MEEKPIPRAKAVLGYAAPDADGLPEFVPEAEQLIDAGRGPQSLRRLLGGTEHAVDYYCKSLRRRYSESALRSACDCGREEALFAIQLSWVIRSSFSTREFQLLSNEAYSTCTTLHAVGPACLADWQHCIGRIAGIGRAVLASWLLMFILLVLGHTLERLSGSRTNYLGVAWLVCLVLAAIARPVFRWFVVRNYPPEVKQMMRKGVTLQGISCIFSRGDGKLCALE